MPPLPTLTLNLQQIRDNFDTLRNQYWFYYKGQALVGENAETPEQQDLFLGGLKRKFSKGGVSFRESDRGSCLVSVINDFINDSGINPRSMINSLFIEFNDIDEHMIFYNVENRFMAVPIGGNSRMRRGPPIHGGGKRKKRCTMRKKAKRCRQTR